MAPETRKRKHPHGVGVRDDMSIDGFTTKSDDLELPDILNTAEHTSEPFTSPDFLDEILPEALAKLDDPELNDEMRQILDNATPTPQRFFTPDPETGSQLASMSFDSLHPSSDWIRDDGRGSLDVLRIMHPSDRFLAAIDADRPRDAIAYSYMAIRNVDDRTRDIKNQVNSLEAQQSHSVFLHEACAETSKLAYDTATKTNERTYERICDHRVRLEELEDKYKAQDVRIAVLEAIIKIQNAKQDLLLATLNKTLDAHMAGELSIALKNLAM